LFLVQKGSELESLRKRPLRTTIEHVLPEGDLGIPAILEYSVEETPGETLGIIYQQIPDCEPPWDKGTHIKVVINEEGFQRISHGRIDLRVMQGTNTRFTVNIQSHRDVKTF
jgi:hypothetical protein